MSAINITQVQVLVRLFQILSFLFFISLSTFFCFLKIECRRQGGVGALYRRERVVLKRARRRQHQQIRRGDENKRGFS
jgi:hypothetical protein